MASSKVFRQNLKETSPRAGALGLVEVLQLKHRRAGVKAGDGS